MKMGTQGSLKYYEIRDPGPHFSMKMGTRGPQFGGSLFSYDTGVRTILTTIYQIHAVTGPGIWYVKYFIVVNRTDFSSTRVYIFAVISNKFLFLLSIYLLLISVWVLHVTPVHYPRVQQYSIIVLSQSLQAILLYFSINIPIFQCTLFSIFTMSLYN